MALHEIVFTIKPEKDYETLPATWAHNGVVGSGDLEILVRKLDNDGDVRVKVVTPVNGYDLVWEKVLRKFVAESRIGGVSIEINDNNATPYIVGLRLKQGWLEAKAGDGR